MKRSIWIKLGIALGALLIIFISSVYLVIKVVKDDLPQIISVKDYQPLLVSQVYDRNNKKAGEFALQSRTLLSYDKMPKNLIHAFLAAEDDQFFQHGGLNYQAIFRAFLANVRAGHTVQGGSTITQQVAKTFFLSNEKKLFRKLQEAMLAIELEKNLKKEDILYLYLNQIYFGNSAYGIENAAQIYFRKSAPQMSLAEMAMMAGLPKAPSEYSPVVNPSRAKERQVYVLRRMAEVGFVTKEESEEAIKQPVKVYVKEKYDEAAPYYLETIRQLLTEKLGEDYVWKKGVKIYASLDLEKQKAAQEAMVQGLKELDKRQGFRGALRSLKEEKEIESFLEKYKKKLILDSTPERTILPDGKFAEIQFQKKTKDATLSKIPSFLKIGETYEGLITKVDDEIGLVYVQLPETDGVIDFESMRWARKPNTDKRNDLDLISKPSQALNVGDVVHVKIVSDRPNFSKSVLGSKKNQKNQAANTPNQNVDLSRYIHLELDQEPLVEGALISVDQQTEDVLAIVGGYSFNRNKLIRAYQAFRQTGSSFKTIVYASALDKGFTASTPIMDAPVVYEESKEDEEGQEDTKVWKPSNHGRNFGGEIIFRNALVQSLNIPTVKIIEDIGVNWAADYAQRLGVFSPLNMDFSLALGSSSLSLYEMTKVFAQFARLGKKIRPVIVKKVTDQSGKTLIENVSLDDRFLDKMKVIQDAFEERRKNFLEAQQQLAQQQSSQQNQSQQQQQEATSPEKNKPAEAQVKNKKEKPDKNFFFEDPDQLIKPQTAYVMTTLLKGVVEDKHGTGGRARALGREVAGKTGTSNGYVDAWFLGYTANLTTGVWVGFDKEKSLGKGEVGGRAALPIWLDFMKVAHEGLPQMTIPAPEGIVFVNIDSETGKLASTSSKSIVRQAFIEGTEPTSQSSRGQDTREDATDFLKRDLSD